LQHDEPNTCVVVPAGYIMVITGKFSDAKEAEGAQGMRWSILDSTSKKELVAVKNIVEQMMDTYTELKNSEYKQWCECVDKYLIPASK
jgi:hypothetical protein